MRARHALSRPGVTLAGVVLVLAGGLSAATVTRPQAGTRVAPPASGSVPVARATVACPDPVATGGAGAAEETATRVVAAAPGARRPGRGGSGGVSVTPLGAAGAPLATGRAPTTLGVDAPPGDRPLVVRATGGAAPGLAAAQLTRSTAAETRGLAGTSCTSSTVDSWFVGSGAVVGRRGRVYLTNTEAAPAVVDVRLYGPQGLLDTPDGRGIAIAPGAQEVRLLDALAPGTTRFAVHVHARQGRVAAAVRDLQVDGLTPLGADWVPATAPPSRNVVVAGVPGGAGPRLLQVVAPGASDAIVRLRLLTPAGVTEPDALDVLEVRAGTVAEVDLAEHTGGEPVGVELRADVPVTAGVLARVTGTSGQLAETAYAAAAAPLTPATPGVVAEVRQDDATTSTLLLTAPAGDATVTLTPLPPATGTPGRVTVAGGSTLAVALAEVSSAQSYALVVTPAPGSGPVVAARQVEEAEARGPLLTSSPVEPGRYAVTVPRAVADLSTGLRLR